MLLERLAWALADESSLVALGLIVEARSVLGRVEVESLREARRAGYTWETIAQWSGLATRQAAQQRLRRLGGVDVVRPDD